jgi:hypothetical protein
MEQAHIEKNGSSWSDSSLVERNNMGLVQLELQCILALPQKSLNYSHRVHHMRHTQHKSLAFAEVMLVRLSHNYY